MKKLFAVLLLLVAGFAHAEEIRIVNGEVRTISFNLTAAGVKVTPEAEKYPEAVAEVFRDRGKEVAVQTKAEARAKDLFHYETQTTQMVGVKYDSASNTIMVVTEPKAVGAPKDSFFWFPFFLIIGMIAVVVAKILARMKKSDSIIYILRTLVGPSAAFVAFTLVAIITRDTVVTFVAVFAALIVAFVAPSLGKEFSLSSQVYHLMMVVVAVAVYYPLFS